MKKLAMPLLACALLMHGMGPSFAVSAEGVRMKGARACVLLSVDLIFGESDESLEKLVRLCGELAPGQLCEEARSGWPKAIAKHPEFVKGVAAPTCKNYEDPRSSPFASEMLPGGRKCLRPMDSERWAPEAHVFDDCEDDS